MNIHTLMICASSVQIFFFSPFPSLCVIWLHGDETVQLFAWAQVRGEQETTLGLLMHFPCTHCVPVNS